MEGLPLAMAHEVNLEKSQEDEQVKSRIDNARFEIEMRQPGSSIQQHPPGGHLLINDAPAGIEQANQRNYACNSIREPCGVFVDAEQMHRNRLHPDEQRGFLPEGLVVYLHAQVIVGNDHLAGTFGKVDLVPIEQVHLAEKRKEQQRSRNNDNDIT